MTIPAALLVRAQAFLDDDPDPGDRAELAALIARAAADPAALRDLDDRFQGPLEFGTAGLRGLIGPGESRMNVAVVLRATAALAAEVVAAVPDARRRGIVIGRDGRRLSPELQAAAAEVALAAGLRVHFLEGPQPTPLVAFAVKALGAAAGIAVTASHNPPEYNGYKVYWENGAQIVPPVDRAIAARIAAGPPARTVPRTPLADGRACGLLQDATSVTERYLDALAGLSFAPGADVGALSIAYSAMHGVGERLFRAVMMRRGFVRVSSVAAQAEPDAAFPTVRFPNPEEPGALDLVLELARRVGADLVLVNDPDADRLAAAVRHRPPAALAATAAERPPEGHVSGHGPGAQPDAGGAARYVVLSGNEIGALLAEHVLAHDPRQSSDRLVMTTIVSSQLLRRMAASHGVHYAETLTGFKWIANRAMALEAESGFRFVLGFEEALGYTVGTAVRDKDGIGAALVLAEYAASLAAQGKTLLDALTELRRRHGVFATRQRSLVLPGRAGQEAMRAAMAGLRALGPRAPLGEPVASVWDLASGVRSRAEGTTEPVPGFTADVLIFELADGGRVAVRPSGTEPKMKLYFEVVEAVAAGEAVEVAFGRAERRLDALEGRIAALVAADR